MPNDERILETMPTGTLGLVATESCIGLAQKVDAYLQGWREHREHQHANESAFKDYYKNSYIIKPSTPRFGLAKLNVLSTSQFVVMICTSW